MDRLVDEVEIGPPGSAPALDRLRAALRSYDAIAVRHPPLRTGALRPRARHRGRPAARRR
jgi:hypothetical protein